MEPFNPEYLYILIVVGAILLFFVLFFFLTIIKRNSVIKKYNIMNDSFQKTVGLDFKSRLKKIKRLSPYNEEFRRGYDFWQSQYDTLFGSDKKVIEGELGKVENAIKIRKIRIAEKFLNVVIKDLQKFQNQMKKLYSEIDQVTKIETTQRLEIERYKEYFHVFKLSWKNSCKEKSVFHTKGATMLKEFQSQFSSFEDHCEIGEFDEVKNVLIKLHKQSEIFADLLTKGVKQENILFKEIPILHKHISTQIKECQTKKIILKNVPFIEKRKELSSILSSAAKFLTNLQFTQAEKIIIVVFNQYQKSEKIINLALNSYSFTKENMDNVYKMHAKISFLRKELEKELGNSMHIFKYRHGNHLMDIYKKQWEQTETLYFDIKKEEMESKKALPFDYIHFSDRVVEIVTFFRNCYDVFYKMAIIQHSYNLLFRQTSDYINLSRKNLMNVNSLINKNTTINKIRDLSIDFKYYNDAINKIENNYKSNQMNELKINNEKVSKLMFEISGIIRDISAEIKKYNVAEKAIIIANRYRKDNPDFGNKISQAEIAFDANEFDKAIELAFSVIKSNNPGFANSSRKIN